MGSLEVIIAQNKRAAEQANEDKQRENYINKVNGKVEAQRFPAKQVMC